LLLRLWFVVLPVALTMAVAPILAALGAAAILFGSVVALRQARLKLLVAYSTVAQIGYLFLAFPLMAGTTSEIAARAWMGGALQCISHAFAKTAMFLAAGVIVKALGHDRIADLNGAGRVAPLSVLTFGLAGLSLMGVPPSGGFTAKWLLLQAAIDSGQWWWALIIVGGGLLTGAYVFRVLAGSLAGQDMPVTAVGPVDVTQERVALGLAVISVVLGLMPLASFGLLRIGLT
jgi:formate hydrogenlyase subunit 3/multisubunit Na+/H+ antiporter MnhD subunit